MSVKTKLDLARDVLGEIRVTRYDEEPDAALKARVDRAYKGLHLEWQRQRIAYWPPEEIPAIVFRPVVRLVAAEIAPSFNKPYDPEDAMIRLRAAVARPWSGKPTVGEYS